KKTTKTDGRQRTQTATKLLNKPAKIYGIEKMICVNVAEGVERKYIMRDSKAKAVGAFIQTGYCFVMIATRKLTKTGNWQIIGGSGALNSGAMVITKIFMTNWTM